MFSAGWPDRGSPRSGRSGPLPGSCLPSRPWAQSTPGTWPQVVVISAVARESLLTYLRDCPGRAPRMEVRAVAGKFELYKDASGNYRFRLKASNGQVIAVGEAYESKASALNGIESVRKNAGDAALDDQTD